MKIWAHTIVRNEERYLWYAVTSIIRYIDKVLIWDTGSTDLTPQIADEIEKKYPGKIIFKKAEKVDPEKFTSVRNEMLKETDSDWFMILDGDEVWWDCAINNATEFIRNNSGDYDSLVSRYYNIIGDIYHFQEEAAGKYNLDNREGHLNIRFINRNIKGLHFDKPHGQQGIYDINGNLVQDLNPKRRRHIEDYAYLHFTNMIRSSSLEKNLEVMKRKIKFKYEIGNPFPKDFYYPEVFFRFRPKIVPSPWENMKSNYYYRAWFQTPLKRIKRRLFNGKSGY